LFQLWHQTAYGSHRVSQYDPLILADMTNIR